MTNEQEQNVVGVLTEAYLPGVTKAVALNLLMHEGAEHCMKYLLGVSDSMIAVGHPKAASINATRIKVRDILKGRA